MLGPMDLPAEILQISPEEAARRIALGFFDEARAAAARLDDADDAEALHDFRVAIRRLRSALRAWREELRGSVGKRDRRALRALQNATGAGRDAEVALAWLGGRRDGLTRGQRFGHDWLVKRLEARRAASMDHVCDEVREGFHAIEADLRAELEVMTVEMHLGDERRGATFAEALARKARESAIELAGLLGRVHSSEDREAAHQTRIATKRLRYLVEPVRGHAEGASAVVKRCKRLQDLLGELNDAHVMRIELGESLETAAAEHARHLHQLVREADDARLAQAARRSERPGLIELTRQVQARIAELFGLLEEGWMETGIHALAEDVEQLATQLEGASRGSLEIERKYLLKAMPDLAELRPEVLEIDQGWLPGDRIRERVRRTRSLAGASYTRTLKFGQGVQRTEIEEATTEAIFDRLWPLTEGCRIHKRRYRVAVEGHTWEIDEFLDRELVLAEVELESPDETPDLPSWLEALVERDVTDDPRYTNLKLAR